MITLCICGAEKPDGTMRCDDCQRDYEESPSAVQAMYDYWCGSLDAEAEADQIDQMWANWEANEDVRAAFEARIEKSRRARRDERHFENVWRPGKGA